MRVLITGGAGFVGSALARLFKSERPGTEVVVLDNLRRRGSEWNVALHAAQGIEFVHGDIRQPDDLNDLKGNFDLFIEASAEPSVLAGLDGAPNYLLATNLTGTLNCLEFARQRAHATIFLSTSRVYSIEPLRQMPLIEGKSRLELGTLQAGVPGLSAHGIAEEFPTHLPRSLYGATKLASEMIIQEYVQTYGTRAVINRCGVIAGAGQFGKVDQGVFTLWVANHYFGKALKYTGFGGKGKQVRDLLHPTDLYRLIDAQLEATAQIAGRSLNVGGGAEISVSLSEMTDLCREATGREVQIASDLTTNPVDIPYYVSDYRQATAALKWRPQMSAKAIVEDIAAWIKANEPMVRRIFA